MVGSGVGAVARLDRLRRGRLALLCSCRSDSGGDERSGRAPQERRRCASRPSTSATGSPSTASTRGPCGAARPPRRIADLDADLIGLQEVYGFQQRYLLRHAPGYAATGAGRTDGRGRGERCAVLYRSARLALTSSTTRWFSDTPDLPGSTGWGNRLPRIVTLARFTDLATRTRLRLRRLPPRGRTRRGAAPQRRGAADLARPRAALDRRRRPERRTRRRGPAHPARRRAARRLRAWDDGCGHGSRGGAAHHAPPGRESGRGASTTCW